MNINNVHISSGRLKPDEKVKTKKNARGIATHNWFTKYFVNIFGSGTLKVKVNGKTCYLNKNSSITILYGSKNQAPDYSSKDDLIKAIQKIFEEIKPLETSLHSSNVVDDDSFVEPIWDSDADKEILSSEETTHNFTPVNWRPFFEDQIAKQLALIAKKPGVAVENGDCFFDAVAQKLGSNLNASKIRGALHLHLNSCKPELIKTYQKMMEGNLDDSFEEFCKNIKFSADEIGGKVIWGNKATVQMVANIFSVKIIVHNCYFLTVDKEDLNNLYQGFENLPFGPKEYGVCTFFDTEIYEPQHSHKVNQIELVNLQKDTWGHFVPVFDL